MREHEHDIINFILTEVFKQTCDLKTVNLAQLHCVINLLAEANLPFTLSFNKGTEETPAYFILLINIAPTIALNITFQLDEGGLLT